MLTVSKQCQYPKPNAQEDYKHVLSEATIEERCVLDASAELSELQKDNGGKDLWPRSE